jgi:LacI family transcriptional regulator, gluconate utilization system Gnt-I transcriptional repressor
MPSAALPARSVTLHDVAREAGVSLITASRALGNPDVVSHATIQKVHAAVEATGYVPNLMAGGLKSKRSMTVAALVPVISVPQFLPTVQALTEELDHAGYQLILGQTGYDRGRERALLDTMVSRRVDGMVVIGLLEPEAAVGRLRRLGIPVVETWDLTQRPVDMLVGFSHTRAGSAVAGHLISKGWRRLGIASADDERATQRREGFQSAAGGEVATAVFKAPGTVRLGRQALVDLLAREPKLQAVHCSSDILALGVLIEAQARGLRVPEDLAVCGFGDADFAPNLEPSLSTVRVEGAEIGRKAAQMILRRCQRLAVDERIVDVGFGIVERASTATPR